MVAAYFLRGEFPQEAEKAEEALEKAGINFAEIHSNDGGKPTLIVKTTCFPYKGIREIERYCNSLAKKN